MQLNELTTLLANIQTNLHINGHMNITVTLSDCDGIIITSDKKFHGIVPHSPLVSINDNQLIIWF
jgi:hypothetical protein